METKQTLQIPEGFEFDHVDSDGVIHVKTKTPLKPKYPLSPLDCYEEDQSIFYIGDCSDIMEMEFCNDTNYLNSLPTRELAKAFLALMQLVSLKEAWNKVDGINIDWSDGHDKYCIQNKAGRIEGGSWNYTTKVLAFGKEETRDKFMSEFADLIEQAKPLL